MNKKLLFSEKKYGSWTLGSRDNERVRQIIELIGENKVVLDIGCGIGEIGELLIKNKNKVYGVDISPTAAKKAEKRGLIVKCGDIEKERIPFKNNYFDIVLAAEVIEHIFDTDEFLKEIRKKLKKKGELIITTPNLATLGRRLLLLLGENPLVETGLTKYSAGHIRYFVKNSLFKLLESHRFKIVHFSSDLVNFTVNGKISSRRLAKIFPTLGRTLIIKVVMK
jgi:2-polyprenyl-3-methyl-5-hydroxy-6-metoxy-1,4-benzoquinol methylase